MSGRCAMPEGQTLNTTVSHDHDEALERFWQSAEGQPLYQQERQVLQSLCQSLSANHGLELSLAPSFRDVLSARHLVRWGRPDNGQHADVICHGARLPFDAAIFDVVVMHHMLETQAAPHHWLREAARVTSDMGHLRIVVWHPFSATVWRKALPHLRHGPPFAAHWLGLKRIRDWLTFVDFEIERVDYCNMTVTPQRHQRLEKWGRRFNIPLGMSMIVTARRHQTSFLPLSSRFAPSRLSGFGPPPRWLTSSRASTDTVDTSFHQRKVPRE